MSNKCINENQIMLLEMIKIYKPDKFDWMSYQITKNNILTLHHILEQVKGGETNIENLALVTKKAHRILNILSFRDIILYKEWNDLFRYINALNNSPDNYAIEYSRRLKKYSQKTIYK